MPSCKFWETQPDGVHGYCRHPEIVGQSDDQCVLNNVDFCYLREPLLTSMQISKDTLEELREYGYPAEAAVKKLIEMAKSH